MTLKEKIIKTLKDTGAENIDKMLQYMEQNEFYDYKSSSHNHWTGGTAQHVWAVYLIAKALRDQRMNEPNIAKYATDKKLAIVCLLHDICDMNVSVYNNNQKWVGGHGYRSYWMMRNLKVGTEAERKAVNNHMYDNRAFMSNNQQEVDEYNALHSLIRKADGQASGTAWNSTRFKEGRTQHLGTHASQSYLRAVAMDRTVQSGRYHLYMDEKLELREYKNYNRKLIKWNSHEDIVRHLNEIERVQLDNTLDVISAAHQYMTKTNERLCLVVGIKADLPKDKDTRLRRGRIEEQDILICSNLLNSLYESKKCDKKGPRRYRFEFTMRDEIKEHYRKLRSQKGGIYLKDVVMIRDGSGRGLPFVEPWIVDILLVPGKKFPMFAIPAK